MKMKFLSLMFLFALSINTGWAQDEVSFEFDNHDRLVAGTPVSVMESNTSKLLTAINKAQSAASQKIDYSGIDITDYAANSLTMTWASVHFRILDDDILQKCVTLKANGKVRGYEASNIAVEMIPLDNSYDESRNQEITISFDKQGRITDFVISMGIHQYTFFMKGAKNLDDIDRRMQILHYVEQFRTAYCKKDLKFLDNVFSDDAIILVGNEQKRVSAEHGMTAVVEYTRLTKTEYLTNLKAAFGKNKYINVKFDDISVEHNPINKNIYGVTLRQEWHSSTYSDVGTVFLLWDFTNEEAPKIYVRTWQPLQDTNRFKTTDFEL